MARLLNVDFGFPTSASRQEISSFPEITLIALLVIAVKVYYPFDAIERHLRSMNDLGTLAHDWDRWCEVQKSQASIQSSDDGFARGDEIKVNEADVFKLSGSQIDSYLDWFEKTWIDEERARNHPRGYPEKLLDTFPTSRPRASDATKIDLESERQNEEEAIELKLRAVQASLQPRQIISDDNADTTSEQINRIGSHYARYKKIKDLPVTAKAFHEAAADLVAIKLHSLLVAVTQMENKFQRLRKKQVQEDETSDEAEAEIHGV